MLSSQEAEGLSIPVGLFVSKDESKDEVRRLRSYMTSCLICYRVPQFDAFVATLLKKPFAAKVASKYYSNMCAKLLTSIPETHHVSPGSTAGPLLVETSRILRTRKNTKTSTPGLPYSSRMHSLERSASTKKKRCLVVQ